MLLYLQLIDIAESCLYQ